MADGAEDISGYVYFVSDQRGHIKIGWTTDPHHRMSSLATGSPVKLKLLALVGASGPHQERMIHAQFHSLRAQGEWFREDPVLMSFIATLPTRLPPPRPKTHWEPPRAGRHFDTIEGVPPRVMKWVKRCGLDKETLASAVVAGDIYLWDSVGLESIRVTARAVGVDLESCRWWRSLGNGRHRKNG